MKRALILAFVLGAIAPMFAQRQASRVLSPEVLPDHRVTFRVQAPKAQEVILTGEFLDGQKPFERDASGLWTVTVGPIEPETYHYNFSIDGVRIIDPSNPHLKTGSTARTPTRMPGSGSAARI